MHDAPPLLPGLAYYFMAYNELSTCRAVGLGAGPIPWTAIQEYADREGMDYQERQDLLFFIRHMDTAHLDWGRQEHEKKISQTAASAKGSKIGQ